MEPRRVLVTAGAGGIGLAVAEAFAADGARVHVCDVDAAALRRVTAAPERVSGSVCDVSDPDAVQRLFTDVETTLGGLDVLVDNAGIAGPTQPAGELDLQAWQSEPALTNQAIGRFVDPAGVAALAVFLAGPHGRSISGQAFPIDGDSTAAQ